MAYTRYLYNRIHWENKSDSLKTPLGKTNLNRMDEAIYNIAENLDIAYSSMQSQKLDITAANKMLRSMPVWDKDTGILTFLFYDGTEFSIDFNVEKIPVSFSMDSAGVITMVTEDGTEWRADIGELIPDYSFEDSDRVAFRKTKKEDGSYSITADIIKGSITGEYLSPDYLAAIAVQTSKAEAGAASAAQSETDAAYDAKLAQSYSVGGSGAREGEEEDNSLHYKKLAESFAHGGVGIRQDEETDNARYYKEEAKKAAVNAEESEKKAKASAKTAVEAEAEAGTQAEAASLSAGSAEKKASEAFQSAESAASSAGAALESAGSASLSASEAEDFAETAESWAVGGTGIREGEDTDNSKYYARQAKESADKAASLSDIGIATEQKVGIVKPDGDTITVDEDGTIHGSTKVDTDSELSETSENPVQNKAVKNALDKKVNKCGDEISGKLQFNANPDYDYSNPPIIEWLRDGETLCAVEPNLAFGDGMYLTIREGDSLRIKRLKEGGGYSTETLIAEDGTTFLTKVVAQFKGQLEGNADTATKAEQDSDGNQINGTYVKNKDLKNHAESSVSGDDGVHGLKYSSSGFEAKDAEGNWQPVPVVIPETPSDIVGAMWFE